jgi:uncharacterized damage-inducible protein DinB
MHEETMALLDVDRRALLAAVERVSDADRDRRPSASHWSVAEVLEHLASVERGVAKLIALRGREPVPPDQEPAVPLTGDRVMMLRMRDRRIDVPDTLRPTGAVSAEAAVRSLAESRAALLAAASAADPVALEQRTYHHPVLGRLTLRDWLAFVAHHEARHAAQIDEIASALAK